MILYPAIDIKNGEVVRLLHGDMEKATLYGDDPAAQARQFADAGCSWIHVVDLDGAVAGESVNRDALRSIIAADKKIQIQFGGGLRDMAAIDRVIKDGVSRVVLGTAALKNPQLVKDAARAYPGKIAIGIDAKGGMVAVEGWVETSTMAADELTKRFEDCGVAAVIFTDIGRDGALKGINIEATQRLAFRTHLPIIASGGVASIDDIHTLASMHNPDNQSGIAGVIAGRAIYDGRLDVAEALAVLEGA